MFRFLLKKESSLKEFEIKNDKTLEYAASTDNGSERVNIELKISSKEMPKEKQGKDFDSELEAIQARIKRVRDYINGWKRSEFVTSLDKAHVSLVIPPIRKTNVILKNPNFQIATKLWDFLRNYDNNDQGSKDGLDSEGNNTLKSILDDAFLMDYFVLDSISSSKREQKDKIKKYAVLMINRQIQRAVSILLNSGVEISEEEILDMISVEIDNEKNKRIVDSTDVKKKFKSAMDEYLEKIQDYR